MTAELMEREVQKMPERELARFMIYLLANYGDVLKGISFNASSNGDNTQTVDWEPFKDDDEVMDFIGEATNELWNEEL